VIARALILRAHNLLPVLGGPVTTTGCSTGAPGRPPFSNPRRPRVFSSFLRSTVPPITRPLIGRRRVPTPTPTLNTLIKPNSTYPRRRSGAGTCEVRR
jgi:hypothetical protein